MNQWFIGLDSLGRPSFSSDLIGKRRAKFVSSELAKLAASPATYSPSLIRLSWAAAAAVWSPSRQLQRRRWSLNRRDDLPYTGDLKHCEIRVSDSLS